MEGKRRLLSGIILGALVGGLASLCNKDAREYTKNKLKNVKEDTGYYFKNPAEGISELKETLSKWNDSFVSNAENTINALEQVEETIEKVTKK